MILRYFAGHPSEHTPIIELYQSLTQESDTDEVYIVIGIAMEELIQALEKELTELPEGVTVGTSLTTLTFFHPSKKSILVDYEYGEYVITFSDGQISKSKKHIISKKRTVNAIISILPALAQDDRAIDRFFVLKRDRENTEEQQYSVQILNNQGQTIEEIVFPEEDMGEVAKMHYIPLQVLQSAIRQKDGEGEYVNQNGNTVHPYL